MASDPSIEKSKRTSWWSRFQSNRARSRMRTLGQVRFSLSREGIHFLGVLLFIFIGAVIREINLLILLAGAMIGLLVLQWRFNTSTLLGVTVRRRLLARAAVDQQMDAQLTLKNTKPWLGAWLVMIEDPIERTAPSPKRLPDQARALVDEIAPMTEGSARYQISFQERGKYLVGPSKLSTRFPIGLGVGARVEDNRQSVVVHPKIFELTPGASRLFQEERQGHATTARKVGTHEAEFFGLRPWATGDSKRWIHWKTSARQGELCVKQFEMQQLQQVCILLDLHAPAETSEAMLEHCEKAISAIASFAVYGSHVGKVSVGVAAQKILAHTNIQSSILLNNFMDDLAVVVPATAPDLNEAVKQLTQPLLSNPHLLVISTRESQATELRALEDDKIYDKLLAKLSVRWLNVSAGELEPYLSWTPKK